MLELKYTGSDQLMSAFDWLPIYPHGVKTSTHTFWRYFPNVNYFKLIYRGIETEKRVWERYDKSYKIRKKRKGLFR